MAHLGSKFFSGKAECIFLFGEETLCEKTKIGIDNRCGGCPKNGDPLKMKK